MTNYVPERFDVIFLDFELKKGKEIGKYRSALVLSSKEYNKKTGSRYKLFLSPRRGFGGSISFIIRPY